MVILVTKLLSHKDHLDPTRDSGKSGYHRLGTDTVAGQTVSTTAVPGARSFQAETQCIWR